MKKNKVERNPLEEIDFLDSMHSALVDLLIEKGIITETNMKSESRRKLRSNNLAIYPSMENAK